MLSYTRLPDHIYEQSINSFLGVTANHPEVVPSKLSAAEREELEQDVTIGEFDTAVELSKNNTALGIDSISNRFIKTVVRKLLFEFQMLLQERDLNSELPGRQKIRHI